MAGDAKKLQPIIVKKIKKGGHAPHGGAWKIAYADFVTAMMAFFLLMWLLGSTTDGDKKGIADYFNSPLKISLMGGSGAGDATSIIKGGGTDITRSAGQVKNGDTEAERRISLQALKEQQAVAERARLQGLRDKMDEVLANSPKLAEFKSQIRLDMTRDGLRIQIVDDQKRAMFDSGGIEVKPYMRELLRAIGSVLAEVPNKLTLEGHTDAQPFGGGEHGYSNWELSSDRANASRRELLAGGLNDKRILRVQGLAASVPFDRSDPNHPINRRISIIVMTREAEDRFFQSGDSAEAPAPEDTRSASESSSPAAPHR
ncbi:MAG: flagellar motor protein MotB [Leptothrix sp. (in: b-proteobacteria)]